MAKPQGDNEAKPKPLTDQEYVDFQRKVVKSHNIARRVLPFLAEHKIPINPNNYRLWYDFFSDGSPELKATLSRMVESGETFTDDVTQALYSRFFSLDATENHCRIIDQAGERVQQMALQVVKALLVSIAQTSKYGQNLDQHIERLRDADDLDMVQNVVGSILEETGVVLSSQENLQRQMEQTSRELNTLHEELRKREELAHTDELTRLYNRRAFNVRLAEEINRARRYHHTLSLIMLDLDDFKKVNDTYGHLVGDRLLAMTAKAIELTIRGADVASRYGGEEFAIICPQTDLKGACRLAERLRSAIDGTDFTVRGVSIRATISLGVALLNDDDGPDDLVDRADRSLYLAKRTGKNRVCAETDLENHPE